MTTPINGERVRQLRAEMNDGESLSELFARLEKPEDWQRAAPPPAPVAAPAPAPKSLQTMRFEAEEGFAAEEVSPTGGARLRTVDALQFIMAGKACVTLRSARTGNRFTYKVQASDDRKVFFVKVLTGQNNTTDYQYLGTIFTNVGGPRFSHGRKSRIAQGAPSARAFAWAFQLLASGKESSDLEVYHEGACGRCGRRLTVPESIETGFGPECAGKLGM